MPTRLGRPHLKPEAVPVIDTKRTSVPSSAKNRRSRVPEIDRLLARWETVEGLTFVDQPLLIELGFRQELEPTRKRGAKVSVKAKVALLVFELYCRKRDLDDLEDDLSSEPLLHQMLLHAAHQHAPTDPPAAEIYRLGAWALLADKRAWRAWTATHPDRLDALTGPIDRAIETRQVVRVSGKRHPVGKRKQVRERYEDLRRELGSGFIDGSAAQREAKVRQWEKRRRQRAERLAQSTRA